MRLAKFLATAGLASRRASEQLIRDGRVTVDGVTVTDPARAVDAGHVVAFDGTAVAPVAERVVYAVHKPPGVVSTARDPQRRPTVVSLVPSARRLYPVGRLDIDATGLILLTNDGDLANRLTHPRYQVPKTYKVVVSGAPMSERAVAGLRAGVRLDDGLTAPARVRRMAWDTIELTLREGRNRQVKRMCEHVGHRVRSLQRVAFGPLALADLPEGAHRLLSASEVEALQASGAKGGPAAASSPSAPTRSRHASGGRGAGCSGDGS